MWKSSSVSSVLVKHINLNNYIQYMRTSSIWWPCIPICWYSLWRTVQIVIVWSSITQANIHSSTSEIFFLVIKESCFDWVIVRMILKSEPEKCNDSNHSKGIFLHIILNVKILLYHANHRIDRIRMWRYVGWDQVLIGEELMGYELMGWRGIHSNAKRCCCNWRIYRHC